MALLAYIDITGSLFALIDSDITCIFSEMRNFMCVLLQYVNHVYCWRNVQDQLIDYN